MGRAPIAGLLKPGITEPCMHADMHCLLAEMDEKCTEIHSTQVGIALMVNRRRNVGGRAAS